MKRLAAKILCTTLAFLFLQLAAQAQALRIGFQTSPMISWINNNDNLIIRNKGNLGLKLGTMADIYFKDNYSFTTGLTLAFHEGGEFLYEIGGNYLPLSDLSDPALNTGDKPLPDGVRIRYNVQYLEIPVGLKIRSKEYGYLRYFVEAPIFTFSALTRGRADIQTDDAVYEKENIHKDISILNIFWGVGIGAELSMSQTNSLICGLYFQSGLFDFVRDKGHRAIVNPGEDPNDPTDDYLKQNEDSRATINNLALRFGIIF